MRSSTFFFLFLASIIPIGANTATDDPPYYCATFKGEDRGWRTGGADVFDMPVARLSAEGLRLSPGGSTNAFGFWESPEIAVEPTTHLRITWLVGCTSYGEVAPQFRLRVNDAGYTDAVLRAVESVGDGRNSPSGATRPYVMDYRVPLHVTSIRLSFDLLSFNSEDDLNADVYLEGVCIRLE